MSYSVTITIDPADTGLQPGDTRLHDALMDLGYLDASPVFGADDLDLVVVVETWSLLAAVADATAIVDRALVAIGAGSARPVRVDAWLAGAAS